MTDIRLLSKKDLVAMLGYSETTIERMVKDGRFIPVTHPGKPNRWRSDFVQAWIIARTVAA